MELFDTHFHWDKKMEPTVIVSEAQLNNVNFGVCIGADYSSSLLSKQFVESFENYWFAAGVHPHESSHFNEGLSQFKELFVNPKLVAVGEIGLDYFYDFSDKKSQLKTMEIFTECALKINKPLIVHIRDKDNKFDAFEESFQILKDFAKDNGTFVVHCFTGSNKWLDTFLELGAFIGITGMVTFPKAENIRKLINCIPDERLLLETDSPYLAPKPFRGKTNYPKYLIETAKKISEIKSIDLEVLADITTKNAKNFYGV